MQSLKNALSKLFFLLSNKNVKPPVFCTTCMDTGEVSRLERVYPNEPHMADVGTGPCPDCQNQEPDDFSGASEGDNR